MELWKNDTLIYNDKEKFTPEGNSYSIHRHTFAPAAKRGLKLTAKYRTTDKIEYDKSKVLMLDADKYYNPYEALFHKRFNDVNYILFVSEYRYTFKNIETQILRRIGTCKSSGDLIYAYEKVNVDKITKIISNKKLQNNYNQNSSMIRNIIINLTKIGNIETFTKNGINEYNIYNTLLNRIINNNKIKMYKDKIKMTGTLLDFDGYDLISAMYVRYMLQVLGKLVPYTYFYLHSKQYSSLPFVLAANGISMNILQKVEKSIINAIIKKNEIIDNELLQILLSKLPITSMLKTAMENPILKEKLYFDESKFDNIQHSLYGKILEEEA